MIMKQPLLINLRPGPDGLESWMIADAAVIAVAAGARSVRLHVGRRPHAGFHDADGHIGTAAISSKEDVLAVARQQATFSWPWSDGQERAAVDQARFAAKAQATGLAVYGGDIQLVFNAAAEAAWRCTDRGQRVSNPPPGLRKREYSYRRPLITPTPEPPAITVTWGEV